MDETRIARAWLIELRDDLGDEKRGGKRVPVQFNPETVKLSYANQVQSPGSSGSTGGAANQSQGSAARQFVGIGATKLTVQLWFDVTAATEQEFMLDDVRRLTAEVLFFMKPRRPDGGSRNASQWVPPGVRFAWGSLLFDGVVDSIEESIELFSPEGKPLRAGIALALSKQEILVPQFAGDGRVDRGRGTQPLTPAAAGQPLQQLAGAAPGAAPGGASARGGAGAPWQQVALANGIENPRALPAGQLIDLAARRPRIVTE